MNFANDDNAKDDDAEDGIVYAAVTTRIPRIFVPMRTINVGMDLKFESDPYIVTLNGVMTAETYEAAIERLNDELKPARSNAVDVALLSMGPMMIPLIPWAIRQKQHKVLRRKLIKTAVENFNKSFPHLWMRWQTRPFKELIIMRKKDAEIELNR